MAWRKPRVCVHIPRSRLSISPTYLTLFQTPQFAALLSASVRARAAYREAVCGRGGAKRCLPFVHLRSADARVRAVGLGGVSVSWGAVWHGESRGFAYISHAHGFQFPDLFHTFPNAAVHSPAFGERARTSRIPLRGMRQRRRKAPPPVRASAFRRCTRARGGAGGVSVSGGAVWHGESRGFKSQSK